MDRLYINLNLKNLKCPLVINPLNSSFALMSAAILESCNSCTEEALSEGYGVNVPNESVGLLTPPLTDGVSCSSLL